MYFIMKDIQPINSDEENSLYLFFPNVQWTIG